LILLKNYKLLSYNEHKELLKIRNLDYVRKTATLDKIILLDEHLKWVENLDYSKQYFAVFYKEKIIGGVHLILSQPLWGMFFKKEIEPFLSMMAVYSFLDYVKHLEIKNLYGFMKKDNKEAIKLHNFFGIEMMDYDDEFYKTNLNFDNFPPKFFKNKKIKYQIQK